MLIHVLMLVLAFPRFFGNGMSAMFCTYGDGLKNYFTLYSYVKEPVSPDGIFKYNSFAYPFGDYVNYTDNTPLFSIIFRWFCYHVTDISAYTIPVYNTCIMLNIVAAGLLVGYIFKAILGRNAIAYLLAVVLPWVNIQLPRLWQGHFNLSCSAIILASIALFIVWMKHKNSPGRQLFTGLSMTLLLFVGFMVHGYYIAIVSVFLATLLFTAGLINLKQTWGKRSLIAAIVIPVAGLALSMGMVLLTDKYYLLRKDSAMDYDHANLKTNFMLLFTHYDFHSLAFPVASSMPLNTELMVYLGNVGLFSFAFVWLGSVLSTSFRKKVFEVQKSFFSDPLKKAIFWAGLISLFISFGEYYTTNRDELKIYTPFRALNQLPAGVLSAVIIGIFLTIFGLSAALNAHIRSWLMGSMKQYSRTPYKKALLLFCTALMIFLLVGRYTAELINIANPFLYLHFLTKKVEQFRSLSRFSWPFFWSFYIWIMYTVVQLCKQYWLKTGNAIAAIIVVTGLLEVSDYIVKLRQSGNNPNLFSTSELARFSPLSLNYNTFQAIIPFPYYVVGSEDYPHTIDDNDGWSRFTMQLSLQSHLPLMACKMSRTPPAYSIALLNLVANDKIDSELRSKLNNKPILLALNRTLINDPAQSDLCTSMRAESKDYYLKANAFVSRHNLRPIDSLGDVFFYSWSPL